MRGTVHKYGDNINTDIITPGKYMELSIEAMARHAMEGVDEDFYSKVKPGDILVCGKNCGSGSSRETAPRALKAAGISAIVAKSFARIFYRNCFNIGLPVLELPETDEIGDGDTLDINFSSGEVVDLDSGRAYSFAPLPQRLLDMLDAGGLVAQLEQEKNRRGEK